ncbi:MAG: restriction endonuclease subunit S, partial [Candidatus Enterosoma sp.]|nr:restriction endonuclease subunit S [bacterium]MDY5548351.1 restriction endonuclease subunit S [Candidatus Enterosoma sp.]
MKTTKLLDVADIIYGYAFDSKLFNTSGEGRPLIRIRDVNTGFSNTYTTENAPEKYLVRNGDFLIGMDGNFEIVKWTNGDALLNQRVCKIIPKSIKPDYLFYLLSPILKNIENKAHSTTVKHLSAKELNKISFELPNDDQQSQIANELSDLHSMLALKCEALEGLDSLIKSRFNEMFGGESSLRRMDEISNICRGASPRPISKYVTDDPNGINWI